MASTTDVEAEVVSAPAPVTPMTPVMDATVQAAEAPEAPAEEEVGPPSEPPSEPFDEMEKRLRAGFDIVVATLNNAHQSVCHSQYVLPQSARIRPITLAQSKDAARVKADAVIQFATAVKVTQAEVALARWTFDDMMETQRETPQAAVMRAKFVESLGEERFAEELARALKLVSGFHLVDPVAGVDAFDPIARGPMYVAHWAGVPFVTLTKAAVEQTQKIFQTLYDTRGIMHHIVDNVAALVVYFPCTDVENPGDLSMVLDAVARQALWVLRADAIRYRCLHRLNDAQLAAAFAQYVFEYHLDVVYENAPSLSAPASGQVYEHVPHWRLYMRILPLHLLYMGPRQTSREHIIVIQERDPAITARATERASLTMIRNAHWELGIPIPADVAERMREHALETDPPAPPEVPAEAPAETPAETPVETPAETPVPLVPAEAVQV